MCNDIYLCYTKDMNTSCKNYHKLSQDGYGIIWNNQRRNWDRAHRRIWEYYNGAIPKGLMVRHLCHNRACVNIQHLALGTMKDNRQDDILAGKDWFRGEKNGNAKLSDNDIDEILAMRDQPRKYGDKLVEKICAKYHIHKTTVHRIWNQNYRSKK